jgi:NADP-dependent aldehyde dehydrogenase
MTAGIKAVDPRTGEAGASYEEATTADVDAAVLAAVAAAHDPALADPARRAALLRGAATRLRAREEEIVALAGAETGLPPVRLHGELGRTAGQLEAFADVVAAGDHLDAILDTADPSATPPRPDIRRTVVPLGPVAVFGASNFPLAFSTAGGDTASALAAGCPVVVKGHPAHPGTSTLVAEELAAAVADAGLPAGTFGHVLAASHEVGGALVDHPDVRAVAFTGSGRGGRALMDRAAARPVPIPVYAEMGSLNPLVVTEAALAARADAIVAALAGAIANFGGQLCTKPGLVLVPDSAAGEAFATALAATLGARDPEVLLAESILAGLRSGLDELEAGDGVRRLTPADADGHSGFRARPAVYRARAAELGTTAPLGEEHFGPAADRVDLHLARGGYGCAAARGRPADGDRPRRGLRPPVARAAGRRRHPRRRPRDLRRRPDRRLGHLGDAPRRPLPGGLRRRHAHLRRHDRAAPLPAAGHLPRHAAVAAARGAAGRQPARDLAAGGRGADAGVGRLARRRGPAAARRGRGAYCLRTRTAVP